MSGLRLLVGLPLAAAVTFGIFMMMNGLISADATIAEARPIEKLVFTAQPPEIDTVKPFKPYEGPDISPPPPAERYLSTTKGERPIVKREPITIDQPGPKTDGGILGTTSVPIVRIEPVFPSRCADRGLEGSVLVEYDLSPDGTVVNPRILSSANRCFERSAIDAVRKWKYSPSGKRIKNVRTSLTFRLAN